MSDNAPPVNDASRILDALDTLLADASFARAPQMSAFLRYVVERTVSGQAGRIKAYSIGVDALGKPPGFDPQTDPSVRVLAKRLRDRLGAYYAHHTDAPLQIVLRSGSYTPQFASVRPAVSTAVGRNDPLAGAHYTAVARPNGQTVNTAGVPQGADPVLYLVSGSPDDLIGRRISFVLSGMLARSGGVDIRRVDAAPAGARAIDRCLAMHTTRLGAELRVDLQLSAGFDGPILQAEVLTLHPASDDSLGRGDFDSLERWVSRFPAARRTTTVAADANQLASWMASAQRHAAAADAPQGGIGSDDAGAERALLAIGALRATN